MREWLKPRSFCSVSLSVHVWGKAEVSLTKSSFQENKFRSSFFPGSSPTIISRKRYVARLPWTSVSSPTHEYQVPGWTKPDWPGLSPPLFLILAYLPGQTNRAWLQRDMILTPPMEVFQRVPECTSPQSSPNHWILKLEKLQRSSYPRKDDDLTTGGNNLTKVKLFVIWELGPLITTSTAAVIFNQFYVPAVSMDFCCSVAQSCPTLAIPWTAACQASLSFTISQSLLRFMSLESVIPSNHLILCHPLLLLPSIFSSIRVFSSESALHIRGPKASVSVITVNTQSLFPLRLTSLIFLLSKGVSRVFSSTTIQKHQFSNTQPSLWSNSQH